MAWPSKNPPNVSRIAMTHKVRVIGRRSSRAVSRSAAVAVRTEGPSSSKAIGGSPAAGPTVDALVTGGAFLVMSLLLIQASRSSGRGRRPEIQVGNTRLEPDPFAELCLRLLNIPDGVKRLWPPPQYVDPTLQAWMTWKFRRFRSRKAAARHSNPAGPRGPTVSRKKFL
jgi:hypothetical protein